MVFNVQVPAGLTNYSMVFYFVSKELTPGSLLQRFVNGDDEFRNSRMKLIPSVPKKRPLDLTDGSGVSARLINTSKIKNSSSNESAVENEETISDNDIDNIVGVANGSELEEMEYPSALLCDLRPYQKHALFFMVRLEKGPCVDDAATTLHPCWDAYHLADKWCHDIGCEQAANKPLLKTVFQVMLRLFSPELCCGVKQG